MWNSVEKKSLVNFILRRLGFSSIFLLNDNGYLEIEKLHFPYYRSERKWTESNSLGLNLQGRNYFFVRAVVMQRALGRDGEQRSEHRFSGKIKLFEIKKLYLELNTRTWLSYLTWREVRTRTPWTFYVGHSLKLSRPSSPCLTIYWY